jgi:two-component system NtrC family sensor kinase
VSGVIGSRQTKGIKEAIDIHALCDEYLRLAYPGLRAKDKSFNADFKTHFNQTIGKRNVIPQDIGKVLLNLYNNSFYAVNEKRKILENYKPLVSVETREKIIRLRLRLLITAMVSPQKLLIKSSNPFLLPNQQDKGPAPACL